MAHVVADAVYDFSLSTGTGAFAMLNTPPNGYRAVRSVCSVNDTFPYRIRNLQANEWEDGIATYSATDQLTRTTVLSGSNGTSAVNFSAGQKEIILTIPAARSVYGDDGGRVILPAGQQNTISMFTPGGDLVQILSQSNASLSLITFQNADVLSGISIGKSRGTTYSSAGLVSNGDTLGVIKFFGYDASGPQEAARIAALVDATPGTNDMPGRLSFYTTPDGSNTVIERLRIQSDGNIVVNAGASYTTNSSYVTIFQGNSVGINHYQYTNDSAGASYWFQKSRLFGAANNGDNIASFVFNAFDGTASYVPAARIDAAIDGAPGANDMPGRLVFSTTPDGSSAAVERLRIDNAGRVIIGCPTGNVDNTGLQYLEDASSSNPRVSLIRYSNDGFPIELRLEKSRSVTAGTNTLVANNDGLGGLVARGADGSGGFIDAARIYFEVDGTPGVGDMPGRIVFLTTPDGSGTSAERMRIDNGGRVIIGGTASVTGGELFQVVSLSAATYSLQQFNAGAPGPQQIFYKSRGTSFGSPTVVQNGDELGAITAYGADGSAFQLAAQIQFSVDATPGSADMPGRISFKTTPDGSATPAERMRIDNAGIITTSSSMEVGGLRAANGDVFMDFHSTVGSDYEARFLRQTGANGVCQFFQTGTGELGFVVINAAPINFYTSNTLRATIDSAGRVIVGGSTSLSVVGYDAQIQNYGTSQATGSMVLGTFNSSAGAASTLNFVKSDNAAIGSYTVVASGDALGQIDFWGAQQTGTLNLTIAARIIAEVDGTVTSGASADMPGRIRFLTTPDGSGTCTECWRIDSSGRLVGGGTAALNMAGTKPNLQVVSTAGGIQTAGLFTFEASANPASLALGKSRSGTIGTYTIVNSGDVLGSINFMGANGTDLDYAAQIQCISDGTPGSSNDMPGRLSFLTSADASASPTERLRIDNAGQCFFPSVTTTAGGGSAAKLDNATTPANKLLRDTSSLRFKADVRDVPDARLRAALDMRVIEFTSKCEADDPSKRFVGLGAEDVAEIDQTLVAWGRERENGPLMPMGVQYDRVSLLRTEALKRHCAMLEDRIKQLEARLQ